MYKKIKIIIMLMVLLTPLTINATGVEKITMDKPLTSKLTPLEQIIEIEIMYDKYNDNEKISDVEPKKAEDDVKAILDNNGFITNSLENKTKINKEKSLLNAKFAFVVATVFSILIIIIIIIEFTDLDYESLTIPIIVSIVIIIALYSVYAENYSDYKKYRSMLETIENKKYMTTNFISDTREIILRDINTTTQENIDLKLANTPYEIVTKEMLLEIIVEKYKLAFLSGNVFPVNTFIENEIDIYNNVIYNQNNKNW